MNKDSHLYDLTQNVQSMIFRVGFSLYTGDSSPISPILQLRQGYAESPAWILVQVKEFLPEPLTVQKFCKRAVYSAPQLIQGFLELMASEQWFERVGDEYHLSDIGRGVIAQRDSRITNIIQGFNAISDEKINRLMYLMKQVIDSCLTVKSPLAPWCLTHSRNRAPLDNAFPSLKIIQYCSDFNAFRDDAHMAAYNSFDISGRSWEAFHFVKQGQANNSQELFEQLAYRGFSQIEWQDSLDELENRKWLIVYDNIYKPSDKAVVIYDEVELMTNEYFYTPWDCLSDDEFDELCILMRHLVDESQSVLSR